MLPTIKSFTYTRILPLFRRVPQTITTFPKGDSQQSAAIVCDPMTWQNLSTEHALISVSPRNWKNIFTREIKFFLCEAAWTGLENNCWRGQVYKDGRVFYENRRELLKILKECNKKKIPTIFWAKEDPTYFNDKIYNFTDTAIKFDYIFTTAKECIEKYHTLGHKNVYLWTFGFSPLFYYPPKTENRENTAVFAGSWYTDLPQRCKDLSDIFDTVLNAGITLQIYDRYRNSGYSPKPFPQKYLPYVKDSINYTQLGNIYRSALYAVNVNTVNDSKTMFARRVYEIMACGSIVISNESPALRNAFAENIWFTESNFDFSRINEIREENIQTVFANHTWEQRINQLCKIIGCEQ